MSERFSTEILTAGDDLSQVFKLRRQVFVAEMGARVASADDGEQDQFDAFASHLVVRDQTRPDAQQIVGVYRLLDRDAAQKAGGFYCESEYDLKSLTASPARLLELGRSCLRPEYRGGVAMFHLWEAIKSYVSQQSIDILFGVASFPGVEIRNLDHPLSLLHRDYLAKPEMRPTSRRYEPMNRLPHAQIDRKTAMLKMPALIKAYLRMGGRVGDGAYIDHAFNTVDICMILETQHLPALKGVVR